MEINMENIEELQSDLLMDLNDAVENMYGDYGGISIAKIRQIEKILKLLEKTLET